MDNFHIQEQPQQITSGGKPSGYNFVGFIRNVGSSPATIIKQAHFSNLLKVVEKEQFDQASPYVKDKPLDAAYQLVPNDVIPTLSQISNEQMLAARNGQINIYILDQILYRDIFGTSHETRYCVRYYPHATAMHGPGFYAEGPPEYLRVT